MKGALRRLPTETKLWSGWRTRLKGCRARAAFPCAMPCRKRFSRRIARRTAKGERWPWRFLPYPSVSEAPASQGLVWLDGATYEILLLDGESRSNGL